MPGTRSNRQGGIYVPNCGTNSDRCGVLGNRHPSDADYPGQGVSVGQPQNVVFRRNGHGSTTGSKGCHVDAASVSGLAYCGSSVPTVSRLP